MKHISTQNSQVTQTVELTLEECRMLSAALAMINNNFYGRPCSGATMLMGFNIKEYLEQFNKLGDYYAR